MKRKSAILFIMAVAAIAGLSTFIGAPGRAPALTESPSSSRIPATSAAGTEPSIAQAPAAASETKPAARTDKLDIQSLVSEIARDLYRDNVDYHARERTLRARLSRFSAADWKKLSDELIARRLSTDEERSSLYIMGLAGETAAHALAEIAVSTVAEARSTGEKRHHDAIRLQALEKLDVMAIDSRAAGERLRDVSQNLPDQSALRPFAEIAILGVQEGRPGKLHRLLEEKLKSHGG